jgi:hypothetical protein
MGGICTSKETRRAGPAREIFQAAMHLTLLRAYINFGSFRRALETFDCKMSKHLEMAEPA